MKFMRRFIYKNSFAFLVFISFLIFFYSKSFAHEIDPEKYFTNRKNAIKNILSHFSILDNSLSKNSSVEDILIAGYFHKKLDSSINFKISPEQEKSIDLFFHTLEKNDEIARYIFYQLKNNGKLNENFRKDVIKSIENLLFYKNQKVQLLQKETCPFQCILIFNYYMENDEFIKALNILEQIINYMEKSNSSISKMGRAYLYLLYSHYQVFYHDKKNKTTFKNLDSIKKEIQVWQTLIPPPPSKKIESLFLSENKNLKNIQDEKYLGGTFHLKSKNSSLKVFFEKQNENLRTRFHLNGSWVMIYDNHAYHWKAKKNIYRTSKVFYRLKSFPLAYSLELNFENSQFRYNSSIIHKKDKLILKLPEWVTDSEKKPVSIYYNKNTNYFVFFPIGIRIFPTSFFSVVQLKDKKLTKFTLEQGSSDFHIKITDIFYEQKDHIQKKQYIKEYIDIPQSIPLRYLNQILVGVINRTGKSFNKQNDIDTLINNFYLEKNKISRLSNNKISEKADSFYMLAQEYEEDHRLWFIAANLYYESYHFKKAEKCAYRYLSIDQRKRVSGLGFSTSEDPDQVILQIYIYSLIQNNKHLKAMDYMKLLKRKDDKTKTTNENEIEKKIERYSLLAQLYIQNRNFTEADNIYRNIIKIFGDNKKFLDSVYYHKIIINMYQRKFSEAKLDYEKIRSPITKKYFEFLKEKNNYSSEKTSIRFLKIKPIMGKGKNYCAPMAVQFTLKALGKKFPSQREIANEMNTQENGTGFNEIINYFKKRNIKVIPYVATLEDIATHLKKGLPVLTLMYHPEINMGHITPIIGVDLDTRIVYFSEPDQTTSINIMKEENFFKRQIHTGNITLFISSDNHSLDYLNHSNPGTHVVRYLDYKSSGGTINKMDYFLRKIELLKHPTTKSFTYYQRLSLIYQKLIKKIPFNSNDLFFIKKINKELTDYNSYYETQIIQGKIYQMYNKPYSAKKSWENALSLNSKSWEASLFLSDLYIKYNNLLKAKKIIEDALEKNPPNIFYQMFLYNLVKIFTLMENYDSAISYGLEIADFNTQNSFNGNLIQIMKKAKAENTLNFLRDIIFGNF